ncbi:MAG: hypothetical protein O2883_09245, partial [Proteobacteria bacterium]|nr:hypothetical protein [Pseudomonadota bacterium]
GVFKGGVFLHLHYPKLSKPNGIPSQSAVSNAAITNMIMTNMVVTAGKINCVGTAQQSCLAKPITMGFDKIKPPTRTKAHDTIC